MRRARRPLVALVALVAALVVGYGIKALESGDSGTPGPSGAASASSLHDVALSALPAQARATVRLIRRGGPFPYPRNDGAVFGNNEHHLPRKAEGYYHEFTVPTPGSHDRGARRIITGGNDEYYYTGDHYESFERVDVSR